MKETTLEKAKSLQDWIVEKRRNFHSHPELSYKEYRTSKIIKEELEKMGIETSSIGETGVVGLIKGKEGGKVIGLRADIDALPVTEQTGLPYASENPGVMHACGDDAHASMLLGAARILSGMKDELKGTVKLIFQPAEEDGTGAQRMIDGGVLKNPDVDFIVGMHVFSDYPAGKIVIQEGPLMASGDQFIAEIYGKQCHGSAPWQGVDANICAMAIVQALQTLVSRVNDARSPIVVNVGVINGGERFNITSGKAILDGANRTFSQETREKLPGWIENIVKGFCYAYGCEYKFEYLYRCAVVVNDVDGTKKIKESMEELIGAENVINTEMIMGSEDFSMYQLKTKGTFMLLGVRNEEKGCTYPIHSEHFTIDEDVLSTGAAGYVEAALTYLK